MRAYTYVPDLPIHPMHASSFFTPLFGRHEAKPFIFMHVCIHVMGNSTLEILIVFPIFMYMYIHFAMRPCPSKLSYSAITLRTTLLRYIYVHWSLCLHQQLGYLCKYFHLSSHLRNVIMFLYLSESRLEPPTFEAQNMVLC
jgi:hypothetical protein